MTTTTNIRKRTYSGRHRRAVANAEQSSRKRAMHRREEVVIPPASEPKGMFNFLGLPGEVRNMVYEHLVPVGHTVLAPNRHSRKSNDAPQDNLRFAHVCRQIRWEFFPLWYKPHIVVRGPDLTRLMQDFVIHGQFGQSNSAVDVLVPTARNPGTADFLPFLKFWRNADTELALNLKYPINPRLSAEDRRTVEHPYDQVVKVVVGLLGIELGPAAQKQWCDFFDKAAMAVVVFYERGLKVRVVVKSRYEEWWMGGGRAGWQKKGRMTEWFRKHGWAAFEDDGYVDVVGPSGL